MQKRRDLEQLGCRTAGMQDWRGAGLEERRTKGMQERTDEEKEGFRTGKSQD